MPVGVSAFVTVMDDGRKDVKQVKNLMTGFYIVLDIREVLLQGRSELNAIESHNTNYCAEVWHCRILAPEADHSTKTVMVCGKVLHIFTVAA